MLCHERCLLHSKPTQAPATPTVALSDFEGLISLIKLRKTLSKSFKTFILLYIFYTKVTNMTK